MATLNGTKTVIPFAAQSKLIYVDADAQLNGENLSFQNLEKGKNSIQLLQVIERYPIVPEKLIREAAEATPYISVVLPAKNPNKMFACMEKITQQSFADFELLVLNRGARTDFEPLPTNFRVINYPGGTLPDALNLGLRRAAGKYILFADENSVLTPDALGIIARAADISQADVIHFAGHLHLDGGQFIFDDELAFDDAQPIFLDEPKQMCALLWLKNKLSTRLDTKIFCRDFLTKHGLTFGDDPSEFLFRALISADEYLLVPQAFCFCKE